MDTSSDSESDSSDDDKKPADPTKTDPAKKEEEKKSTSTNSARPMQSSGGAATANRNYLLNLYGADDLFAQLQAENSIHGPRPKWTPNHGTRDDYEVKDYML